MERHNAYTATISSDVYVSSKDSDGTTCLNWASEEPGAEPPDSKEWGPFRTFQEASEFLARETEGSRWYFYPSAFIYDECCGQVWESVPVVDKCKACGHAEEWREEHDDHHDAPKQPYHLEDAPEPEAAEA